MNIKILYLIVVVLFQYTNGQVFDACGVENGNNCSCLTYASQSFPTSTCNSGFASFSIYPLNPNVDIIPGSCGTSSWSFIAPSPQISPMTLNPVSGLLAGTFNVNAIPGFPLSNNPLIVKILGLFSLYPLSNFTLTYTFTFPQVCDCLSYNDNDVCNGVEACNPMDGQQTLSSPALNCNVSNDKCIEFGCNPASGCTQNPWPSIGQSCYEGPAGTGGVGVCRSGVYACESLVRGVYCDGQVLPTSYPLDDCGDTGLGNGLDDNCNGVVDEGCNGSGCSTDADCLPYRRHDTRCTTAHCDTGTHLCVFSPLPAGTPCPSQSNRCYDMNGANVCNANGECVGTVLNASVCEDNNICTTDSCSSSLVFNGATPFVYAPPVCTHTQVNSSCHYCTLASQCLSALGATPCHTWECSAQNVCVLNVDNANLVGCDDGNLCNGPETCVAGTCVPAPVSSAVVCNDGIACTVDTCHPTFGCQYNSLAAAGLPCNDTSNLCHVNGMCNVLGQCVGVLSVDCAPLNECYLPGVCDPLTGGCGFGGFSVDGTLCTSLAQQANLCVEEARCYSGACTVTRMLNCADSPLPCHSPGPCDPLSGTCPFVLDPIGTSCNSGDYCEVNGTCNALGVCVSSSLRNCSHLDDACIVGKCNSAGGFCYPSVRLPTGGPCNADNSVCTVGDSCSFGLCVAGTPIVCDDGNPCTDDTCDPVLGCVSTPNNALACSSYETFCNTNARCLNGSCITTPRQCNLTVTPHPCKTVACSDVFSQCVETTVPNGFVVSDGLVCNGNEVCTGGVLTPGTPLMCHNTNMSACSMCRCEEPVGCVCNYTNAVCQDGNPCTINDRCVNGVCMGINQKDCSYFDSDCSLGFCNATNRGACESLPINEGGVCGPVIPINTSNTISLCMGGAGPKSCTRGVCSANITIPALICDDNDPCTINTCDEMLGCVFIGPVQDICGVCGGTTTNYALCRRDYSHWNFLHLFIVTCIMAFVAVVMCVVFSCTTLWRKEIRDKVF